MHRWGPATIFSCGSKSTRHPSNMSYVSSTRAPLADLRPRPVRIGSLPVSAGLGERRKYPAPGCPAGIVLTTFFAQEPAEFRIAHVSPQVWKSFARIIIEMCRDNCIGTTREGVRQHSVLKQLFV